MDVSSSLANESARVSADQNETFAAFRRFSTFFCELFSKPGFLDGAACRDSYKQYVPRYYRAMFGKHIDPLSPRHLKWYRRLSPLFALPRGSSILDYGGGYGLDSIFLASLGYDIVFYEITPHHIAVARWLSERFGERFGALPIRFVHVGKDPEPSALDAVLVNEVAHHIEPPSRVFETAAAMLRQGGHLFLLEPNFFCPLVQAFFLRSRGFSVVEPRLNEDTGETYLWGNEHIRPISVWNRYAKAAGFSLAKADYVIPWLMRGSDPTPSALRAALEKTPLARDLVASHVTLHYVKR